MIEDPIITSKKRRVSDVSVSIGSVKSVVLEKDSGAENTPQCVPHVSTCIGKKDREVGPGVEENTSQSLQIISENINCCLCEVDSDVKESVKPPNEL